MPHFLKSLTCAALLFVSAGAEMHASPIEQPSNEVVLTVTGEIAHTNADNTAVFDMDMLMKMETVTINTSTIWTEGVQVFEGVSLHDLFEALGVAEGTMLAIAINDYKVEIPVSDASVDGPIIAYKLNGEMMSVRDKGPLWVVYPYDSNPAYRSEVIYSRSIWQLDRLEFVK